MIHQNLIKRRADEDGLSAPAVERDYVLAHVLAAISEHDRQARRLQCRDLYDLHQLLVAGGVDAEAIWPLFERKARHRDRDPDRFGDYLADHELRWGERWDKELAEYVTSPPHFDGVLRAVRRELRFALVS